MPAFFHMVQQGILRDPVFSVWLDPNPNAVPAGEVLFGGAEPNHFQGPLHFIRVISQKCAPPSYIEFPLWDCTVRSQPLPGPAALRPGHLPKSAPLLSARQGQYRTGVSPPACAVFHTVILPYQGLHVLSNFKAPSKRAT